MCLVPGRGHGAFAYVDQADQRVWWCDGSAASVPRALSAVPPVGRSCRHGGLSASADGDWILAVRETHTDGSTQPARHLVALSTRGPAGESILLGGHDFVSAARMHPSGDRLVVVVWDHPDMPWDASTVLVLPVARSIDPDSGNEVLAPLGPPWAIAGGPHESVGQPAWHQDGSVRFVSDRQGWWQPYLHRGDAQGEAPRALSDQAAEFHGPDWVLGQATMTELADGTVVARMVSQGQHAVVALPASGGLLRPITQPCVSIAALCAHGDGIAFIGATPDAPPNVWVLPRVPVTGNDPPTAARALRPSPPTGLDPSEVARSEPFACTGRSGRPIFGSLYRPTWRGAATPPVAKPPLVVWCHGGPTSASEPGFDLGLQFFTTRGFAVACVDYAGSTGYGRIHRCALWGQWGVADAEDCLDAAHHLANLGLVDQTRMAIRGGSAGGLTALNALAAGEGFGACVSWYGVTDLLGLAATTHDFEAHYMDRLVGPLPESEDLYKARSPALQASRISGSVLLLQGTDDAVVPPAQAENMRHALTDAGSHCELVLFEGEGHGFRRADTLAACFAAELDFYRKELDLHP